MRHFGCFLMLLPMILFTGCKTTEENIQNKIAKKYQGLSAYTLKMEIEIKSNKTSSIYLGSVRKTGSETVVTLCPQGKTEGLSVTYRQGQAIVKTENEQAVQLPAAEKYNYFLLDEFFAKVYQSPAEPLTEGNSLCFSVSEEKLLHTLWLDSRTLNPIQAVVRNDAQGEFVLIKYTELTF